MKTKKSSLKTKSVRYLQDYAGGVSFIIAIALQLMFKGLECLDPEHIYSFSMYVFVSISVSRVVILTTDSKHFIINRLLETEEHRRLLTRFSCFSLNPTRLALVLAGIRMYDFTEAPALASVVVNGMLISLLVQTSRYVWMCALMLDGSLKHQVKFTKQVK